MKEGWEITSLGDSLILMRNGINCKQKKDGLGSKVTRIQTIADGTVNPNKVGYANLTESENKKYRLKIGDVLFSHINSPIHVGKTAYVEKDYGLIHGMNLLCFRTSEEVDPKFLEYYLKNLYWSGFWKTVCKQSVNQASVNMQDIKKVTFAYPSLILQKRIVAILDEAFAGIDTAIANTEKNLANARELFESFLSLVFNKQSEGWEERKLGDICSITSKLVDPRDNRFIDLKHVGAGNIVSFTGDLIQVQTARDEGLISGKFIFDEHMVLYSKIRPYLMKVARPNFIGLCSADIYPLKPLANLLDRDFLYYLLLHNKFTKYAIAGSDRAGMPKVNREHLFQYSVALPEVFEQKKITEQLDVIAIESHKIEIIYKQKLNSLKELKQSLLQKAFSGELTAKPDKLIDENVA